MLVYLDTCCLNRPYDDQSQTRIQMETAAILAVIQRVVDGQLSLSHSQVLAFEVNRNPEELRREGILNFLGYCSVFQVLDAAVEQRGTFLHSLGFKRLDALHLASAEALKADIFLTTDDRFAACATRNSQHVSLPVINPIQFLTR
jgi:predicted nucleic acid-binding protein